MFNFKTVFGLALALVGVTSFVAFAATGTGLSSASVLREGIPITQGDGHCTVECDNGGPIVAITTQRLEFGNDVQIQLADNEKGSVSLEPNGQGQIDVTISLPSNVIVGGDVYNYDSPLVLNGTVDVWPGDTDYTLAETTTYSNGSEILTIEQGAVLSLSVQ